jgi:hypothetical protein
MRLAVEDVQAIQEHKSQVSEANGVISNFGNPTGAQRQDLLNFPRPL